MISVLKEKKGPFTYSLFALVRRRSRCDGISSEKPSSIQPSRLCWWCGPVHLPATREKVTRTVDFRPWIHRRSEIISSEDKVHIRIVKVSK